MDDARRFLVAYDVSHDGRRSRVAKVLETYGDRVQYSVFLVESRPAKLLRMRLELEALAADDDSILIADLGIVSSGEGRSLTYVGRRRGVTPRTVIVL